MRIATILFTYHRYKHTKAVLEGIKNNTILPEKLFIFQDGIGDKTNIKEWKRVNSLIKKIDFCEVEVVVSDNNKGLSESIISGINRVMDEYDAMISLEDDCVPHPLFIEYMYSGLNKFRNQKKVWSINGYTYYIDVPDNGYDAYFIGRSDCCGWATWKDRWKYYEQDYKLVTKIRKDRIKSEQFDIWGQDLSAYLEGNINGRNDSWAVFWDLQVLYRGGCCLFPYESLINNIGFDNTGEHSGERVEIRNYRNSNNLTSIRLPDRIEFPKNYKDIFIDFFHRINPEKRDKLYKDLLCDWMKLKYFGVSIVDRLQKREISRVSVWGTGKISELLINEIKREIKIFQIIKSYNSNGQKLFEGIEVVGFDKECIYDRIDAIIVIPFYDIDIIRRKLELKGNNIRCVGIDELVRR